VHLRLVQRLQHINQSEGGSSLSQCEEIANGNDQCLKLVSSNTSGETIDLEQTVSCLTRCDASDPYEDRMWVV
jgi:hypothetical protein